MVTYRRKRKWGWGNNKTENNEKKAQLRIYGLLMFWLDRVPVVGGKALDLHQLFVEVTSRGGLEKVLYLQ